MSEKPIIFCGDMIRAILDVRKTQMRRIVKPLKLNQDSGRPQWDKAWVDGHAYTDSEYLHLPYGGENCIGGETTHRIYSPYGQVGDLLWVRENWRVGAWNENEETICIDYKADNFARKEWLKVSEDSDSEMFQRLWIQSTNDAVKAGNEPDGEGNHHWKEGDSPCRWRSPLFMPKWAARIWLEITGVKVQRLQEITEEDAKAEGIYRPALLAETARGIYKKLWDKLNGIRNTNYELRTTKYAWRENPLVWVIEFRRIVK